MSNFKSIVLNKTGDQFTREVKNIDKSFLIHGDVLVKVDYSDFNYKVMLMVTMTWLFRKIFQFIATVNIIWHPLLVLHM